MRNLIKTFTFVGIVLFSFLGCAEKADYEDKDLTKFFIKNNKEKLNRISSIDVFFQYQGLGDRDGSYKTSVKLSFFNISTYYNRSIDGCVLTMFISNSSVEFLKSDVIHYGKESMYKQAQKCLDEVIHILDNEKKEKKEKSIQEMKDNAILSKKFNESEIESKK